MLSFSCESDDICPESALTTPQLIVTFYDMDNPEERKSVQSLGVYIIKNNGLILLNEINGINTDSITIPLRDDESVSNFKFCKDFSEDITVIPNGLPNHLYFDYEIDETFVSRACGFINNYNLSIDDLKKKLSKAKKDNKGLDKPHDQQLGSSGHQ